MISEAELLLKLTNYEDHFVERKTSGDSKDWLKTVVGFANSTPIGYPAVLFIGVRDNGGVEDGLNLDSLQKTLGKKLNDAYPSIYYLPRVLTVAGKQCLAVIVPGSEAGPHFAGPSYVRVGSETVPASEPQFQALVAQRNSKVRAILQWVDKEITVAHLASSITGTYGESFSSGRTVVQDCNQHYCTLREVTGGNPDAIWSIPLNRIELGFDHKRNRLQVYYYPDR
jgi:hypothetical protein